MSWIKINGKVFSVDQVLSLGETRMESLFERNALSFCQAWLSGQTTFTLSTSGSTGAPKTITINREQMEASARQTILALGLKAGETSIVCLDPQYIAGQMMLVRGLLSSMNMVITQPSANPFLAVDEKVDFAALVPYQLDAILSATTTTKQLDNVRCAIIGGAPVSRSLKERTATTTCAIFATYGMTETLSHIALQRVNGSGQQEYFEAFPTISLRTDSRGCLCIKAGYLPDEIVTNDLVELVSKRRFKWLGRIDHVINSGGVKVIPEKVEMELERILDSYAIRNRFFVTALPDEKLGQRVVAVFEGSAFSKEVREDIMEENRRRLFKYEVPKDFFFIDQFQETATGKINRAKTLQSLQPI